MNTMSPTRLRVECLETRNLLSAIGLPLVPPVAPPSPAAPAAIEQVGGDQLVKPAVQDAVGHAAAMPAANQAFTPDQLSPALADLSLVAMLPGADPVHDPVQLSAGPVHWSSGLPFSSGAASGLSGSTTLVILELPSQGVSGDVAPNASPAVNPAVSPSDMMSAVQPVVASMPPGPGPAGFQVLVSRPADQAVATNVPNDASSGVESSPSPTKGSPSAAVAAYAGDQTSAAVGTPLSVSNGAANLPATNAALSNAASSNSMEGGFIALDDVPATAPQLASVRSYDTGFQGVGSAGLGGNWLTNVLPGTRESVDAAGGDSRSVPSGENLANAVFTPRHHDLAGRRIGGRRKH